MRIIVDAMGGDHAPLEILRGCESAVQAYGVEILLVGPEEKLKAFSDQVDFSGMTLVNASQEILMTDHAEAVVREKKDSSMAVGMRLLHEGAGDAFVSAGNTGAVITGATLFVKRMPGVKRGAIGSVLPCAERGKTLLIDCGANAECTPEFLHQFAVMGSLYMREFFGIAEPLVGLLSNGTEDTKGTKTHIEANALLRSDPSLHFAGNIEGRDGPLGAVDVIVADGFSGNVYLKTLEGMGKLISGSLKEVLYKNLRTKIGAFFMKKELMDFKKGLDYSEFGGAPILGVRGVVIKAHGSSDARAFQNAIRQAIELSKAGMVEKMTAALSPVKDA